MCGPYWCFSKDTLINLERYTSVPHATWRHHVVHQEYQVPSRCPGVSKIVIFTIYISTHPRPTNFFEFKHDIFANPLDILEKPDILDISFLLVWFCKVSHEKHVSVYMWVYKLSHEKRFSLYTPPTVIQPS